MVDAVAVALAVAIAVAIAVGMAAKTCWLMVASKNNLLHDAKCKTGCQPVYVGVCVAVAVAASVAASVAADAAVPATNGQVQKLLKASHG